MSLIVPKKDMEVRKSEKLLKARYSLGELALKLISIIYSNVKRSDEIGKDYEIRVDDIAKLMGKDYGNIYNYLKKAVDEMLENPVRIEIEKGKEWVAFNWISDAYYKDGVISFTISKRLKPYILDLQQKFVKYRLENILNLKGIYTIRLYEILKDNLEKNLRYGKKAEFIESLYNLREILEVPKSYQYSSHIKNRILEKSKKEISEKTDIFFDYEEIKTGRKITHIKFIIKLKPIEFENKYNTLIEKYFKSRAMFVKLLRDNYKGNGKFFGTKIIERENYWIGIDKEGLMYATPIKGNLIRNLNSIESGEIYDLWFKIAQNSDLYKDLVINGVCLKELYQENKELYLEFVQEINILKELKII